MNVSFLISAFYERQYPPPNLPEVAFAGRSNVGKSSLINVLVKRKSLARTSSKPGRTQAINFFLINDQVFFVDLPGYGYARVPIKIKKSWERMVETYLRNRPNLRAVVVILDIRRELTSGDLDLLKWLKFYNLHAIPILTKADKLSRQKVRIQTHRIMEKYAAYSIQPPIVFSAKTGQGRDAIWEEIINVTTI